MPIPPYNAASSSAMQGDVHHISEATHGRTSEVMERDTAGSRPQWQADSVRKLFDKELDNHHEEKLLLAQVTTGLISGLPP